MKIQEEVYSWPMKLMRSILNYKSDLHYPSYDNNHWIANTWNDFLDSEGIRLESIWKFYSEIKNKFDNGWVLISKKNEKRPLLRCYGQFFNQMMNFFLDKGQFPTNCYEDWLYFTGKMNGMSPFIRLKINNSSKDMSEVYLVLNANYKWNKIGFERFRKYIKPNNQKYTFLRIIADEISLNNKIELKTSLITQMQRKNYRYPDNSKNNNKSWFTKVFKLKSCEDLITELLELFFRIHVERLGGEASFRNHAKDSPRKMKLLEFYNTYGSVYGLFNEQSLS
ncbi:hypothetical protein CEE45_11130 [Candidatus Heimdallarchaeota archaeon B3_Heim]|nr:MAG: hypothetical protein CEE45_11130 [Candidatus Heimdallarchaeota archaeon B3_Heim]